MCKQEICIESSPKGRENRPCRHDLRTLKVYTPAEREKYWAMWRVKRYVVVNGL